MNNGNSFNNSDANGIVFVAYHKPFPLLREPFLQPIHAGRACMDEMKDGKLSSKDIQWLTKNTIGDNTGENISARNREYCECTSLYWVWKNVDFSKLKYIGFFQYRRQLILNDYFQTAKNDREKRVYKCVHFPKEKGDICHTVGLSDSAILSLLEQYDCIVPYATSLEKMNVPSVYCDWTDKIEGVHVDDLILLEEYMKGKYPEDSLRFSEYLNSPRKVMYQIFIANPDLFNKYCEWLFDILFDIDKKIDSRQYTVNGRRTMGYLAEVLYGFFFTKYEETHEGKVLQCGVTYLE